jgi:hypothetical protein
MVGKESVAQSKFWSAGLPPCLSRICPGTKNAQVTTVSDRIIHDLRRTAVRNLERAGVPRSVGLKLTGHKTEAVYRRYAIATKADLTEGVAKLARLHERLGASIKVQLTSEPVERRVLLASV